MTAWTALPARVGVGHFSTNYVLTTVMGAERGGLHDLKSSKT